MFYFCLFTNSYIIYRFFFNYNNNFEKTHTNSSSTMQAPILVLDNGGNTIKAGVVSNGGTFE